MRKNEDSAANSIVEKTLDGYHRMKTYPDNNKIQQSINSSPFEFRFAGILHQFSILSGKYHHTITPLRVPQNATS